MLLKLSLTTTALVALSAVATTAQAAAIYPRADNSTSTISPACQSSLFSLLSSPASGCLNLKGLLAVVTSAPTSSLIMPIEAWLGDFCSAGACTAKDLTDTVGIITAACSAELTARNISATELPTKVVQYYAPVRKLVCLKGSANPVNLTTADGVKSAPINSKKAYCLPPMLRSIESAFSITFSRAALKELIPQLRSGKLEDTAKTKLRAIFACTQCGQAALDVLKSSDAIIKNGAKRLEITKKMGDAVQSCPANIKSLEASLAKKTSKALTGSLFKLQRREGEAPADVPADAPAAAIKARVAALSAADSKKGGDGPTAAMNSLTTIAVAVITGALVIAL